MDQPVAAVQDLAHALSAPQRAIVERAAATIVARGGCRIQVVITRGVLDVANTASTGINNDAGVDARLVYDVTTHRVGYGAATRFAPESCGAYAVLSDDAAAQRDRNAAALVSRELAHAKSPADALARALLDVDQLTRAVASHARQEQAAQDDELQRQFQVQQASQHHNISYTLLLMSIGLGTIIVLMLRVRRRL